MKSKDRKPVWNGFCKVWLCRLGKSMREIVQSDDSLNLLVFVTDTKRILLLSQPRPGKIFLEGGDGKTVANIAGRFDERLTPAELAIKEAKEEAGVNLRPEQVELLNGGKPMYLSPGLNTERAWLAYAEITSGQIESEEREFGAAGEDEQITRVWMPIHQFMDYPCEDVRLFALREWFFRHKIRISAV